MPNENESFADPLLRRLVPWKANISLVIVAAPALRRILGRFAFRYLYTQVLVDPKTMAFLLLTRLGWSKDPVFVWHLFNLLLRIPDEVYADKWLQRVLPSVENIPGQTLRERISVCERVVLQSFGLWKIVAEAAKVRVDYRRLEHRIASHERDLRKVTIKGVKPETEL